MVPLLQLSSLSQLVENMHNIEVISPRTNLWISQLCVDIKAAPALLLCLQVSVPVISHQLSSPTVGPIASFA